MANVLNHCSVCKEKQTTKISCIPTCFSKVLCLKKNRKRALTFSRTQSLKVNIYVYSSSSYEKNIWDEIHIYIFYCKKHRNSQRWMYNLNDLLWFCYILPHWDAFLRGKKNKKVESVLLPMIKCPLLTLYKPWNIVYRLCSGFSLILMFQRVKILFIA